MGLTYRIGHHLEMRQYTSLQEEANTIIKQESWPRFLELLREQLDAEVLDTGWDIPLAHGKVRDGMKVILNLEDLPELDIDFLKAFEDLEGGNLDQIRPKARERAVDLLRDQIAKGNTFFIDAESLKETELTVLIPHILEARTREIQVLEPDPPLSEVYSTYYGFSILTTGGVTSSLAGIIPEVRDQLVAIMNEIGDVENISTSQLKFSYLSFRQCTSHLKLVLWNLLKMSIGGQKSQRDGIRVLGELADSRALNLMHLRLENAKNASTRRHLVSSITQIGSPASFEIIKKIVDNERYSKDTLEALGCIRHQSVQTYLASYRHDGSSLFRAMGNTRSTYWIPRLEERLKYSRRRYRRKDLSEDDEIRRAIEKIQRVNV